MPPIADISPRSRPAWRWSLYAAAALAISLAAVYYFRHDPARTGGLFPPCIFYRLTHLYCPGCGSQRAAHQLLHGHFLDALRYNPLLCLAIPVLAWEALAKLTRRIPSLLDRPGVGWTISWVILAFWIGRNIPLRPCTLLAPPDTLIQPRQKPQSTNHFSTPCQTSSDGYTASFLKFRT